MGRKKSNTSPSIEERVGVGLAWATTAIRALERIPADDVLRTDAHYLVLEYCDNVLQKADAEAAIPAKEKMGESAKPRNKPTLTYSDPEKRIIAALTKVRDAMKEARAGLKTQAEIASFERGVQWDNNLTCGLSSEMDFIQFELSMFKQSTGELIGEFMEAMPGRREEMRDVYDDAAADKLGGMSWAQLKKKYNNVNPETLRTAVNRRMKELRAKGV
jgi:hypothetical protein